MKTLFRNSALFLTAITMLGIKSLQAQNTEKKTENKIRVKVISIENGKQTMKDTLILNPSDEDKQALLKQYNVDLFDAEPKEGEEVTEIQSNKNGEQIVTKIIGAKTPGKNANEDYNWSFAFPKNFDKKMEKAMEKLSRKLENLKDENIDFDFGSFKNFSFNFDSDSEPDSIKVKVLKSVENVKDGKGKANHKKIIIKKINISTSNTKPNVPSPARKMGRINSLNTEAIAISPNPNTGKFTLEIPATDKEQNTLVIVNSPDGKELYRQNLAGGANSLVSQEIDLGNVPNGVYLVKCTQGDEVAVKKMVVQK